MQSRMTKPPPLLLGGGGSRLVAPVTLPTGPWPTRGTQGSSSRKAVPDILSISQIHSELLGAQRCGAQAPSITTYRSTSQVTDFISDVFTRRVLGKTTKWSQQQHPVPLFVPVPTPHHYLLPFAVLS